MKIQFKTGKLAVSGLWFICAMAFATSATAANPNVKMTIEGDQLVITSKKDDNGCDSLNTKRPESGCIKVKKNDKATIDFLLTGDTKCGLENGIVWELNAVYLGGYNFESKPAGFGFDSTPDADFNKVNADFNVIDRSSGLVSTTVKSETKITINDENQSEYTVWYKVEALCQRTDGNPPHTTFTDPRVANGGAG